MMSIFFRIGKREGLLHNFPQHLRNAMFLIYFVSEQNFLHLIYVSTLLVGVFVLKNILF